MRVIPSNKYVVHVYEYVDNRGSFLKDEQRGIEDRVTKTKTSKEGLKLNIPHLRSLFQTVYGFPQATNMSQSVSIYESRRLFHVDFIGEGSLGEDIINI